MIMRVLKAALVAGFLAACVAATLQTFLTSPLILEAETFEKSAGPQAQATGYGGLVQLAHVHSAQLHSAQLHLAHGQEAHADAEEGGWEPGEGFPRIAFTALATLVSGVGYAAILAALLLASGREFNPQTALRWAIGGFVAVNLAPAVGLPPELPGMGGAHLAERQIWWVCTALGTGLGLYLVTNVRHHAAIAIGLLAIVFPHIIGAPHAAAAASDVPAVLAAQFAARSLAVAFAFWATLGLSLGWYWVRQEDRTTSGLRSQALPVSGERKAV
ncbi:CbtA family protein [Microvirga zambiensis]|uniref:CbtA family protein n=1 Tax=Microvirga zambiensis TaxID=1402137 RepID=UPI00191F8F3B|nr:CbtA family protein [Microvirga zambiensis]